MYFALLSRGKCLIIPVVTSPFVLRNFFGDSLTTTPNALGEIVIEAEAAPKYLSLPGCDGEACCQLLGRARLE